MGFHLLLQFLYDMDYIQIMLLTTYIFQSRPAKKGPRSKPSVLEAIDLDLDLDLQPNEWRQPCSADLSDHNTHHSTAHSDHKLDDYTCRSTGTSENVQAPSPRPEVDTQAFKEYKSSSNNNKS